MKITILYDTGESTIAVKDKILSVLGNASLTFEKGGKAVSDWVSVKDRLPKETETVIVYDTDVHCAWYDCEEGCFADETFWYGDVTHWMPLPKPPKENE